MRVLVVRRSATAATPCASTMACAARSVAALARRAPPRAARGKEGLRHMRREQTAQLVGWYEGSTPGVAARWEYNTSRVRAGYSW